jgi:hypothetical protein
MIAEPPISDIRAKAEARRAKTLARERDRIAAAKGEKVNLDILYSSQTI